MPLDESSVPRGLRTTFLLNFVIGALVGLQHLVAPRVWTDLAGIAVTDTVLWRLVGAAVLGYAVGSGLAWRDAIWPRVRIVVAMQAVWSVLGAAVIAWGVVYEGLPRLEWVNVGALAAFAAAFSFYLVSGGGAATGSADTATGKGTHEHGESR